MSQPTPLGSPSIPQSGTLCQPPGNDPPVIPQQSWSPGPHSLALLGSTCGPSWQAVLYPMLFNVLPLCDDLTGRSNVCLNIMAFIIIISSA